MTNRTSSPTTGSHSQCNSFWGIQLADREKNIRNGEMQRAKCIWNRLNSIVFYHFEKSKIVSFELMFARLFWVGVFQNSKPPEELDEYRENFSFHLTAFETPDLSEKLGPDVIDDCEVVLMTHGYMASYKDAKYYIDEKRTIQLLFSFCVTTHSLSLFVFSLDGCFSKR